MLHTYSWDRLLCGDYKHRLVELPRAHSITGRKRAIDCVKPERLSWKAQTPSGDSHALRSTCASGTRYLAQYRFSTVLVSSAVSIGWRVTHERHGFVFRRSSAFTSAPN